MDSIDKNNQIGCQSVSFNNKRAIWVFQGIYVEEKKLIEVRGFSFSSWFYVFFIDLGFVFWESIFYIIRVLFLGVLKNWVFG